MILSVEAENLLSFKELNVQFKSGITSLEGYNHDNQTNIGAGKSAIVDIVCFTLFGEIPRNVKIDDIIRFNAKTAFGKVELTNGYGIVRSRKPNDLFLYKLESPLEKIKGRDSKETQQMIEELLGMTFKTFCQAVYFAQNYQNKFVTATEEDKAKILSEIEDLSQFDKARKEATTRLKEIEPQYNLAVRDVQNLSKTIEILNEHKMGLLQLKGRFEIEKQEKWEERISVLSDLEYKLESKKQEHQTLVASLETTENRSSELRSEQDQILQAQSVIKSEITKIEVEAKNIDRLNLIQADYSRSYDKLNREIAQLETEKSKVTSPSKGDNCPTCGSDLSKADTNVIEQHIQNIETAVLRKKNDKAEILSKSTKLALDLEKINVPNEKLQEFKNDLSALEESRKNIAKELLAIEANLKLSNRSQMEIESLEDRIKNASKLLKEVELENTNGIDEKLTKLFKELDETVEKLNEVDAYKTSLAATLFKLNTLKDGFKDIKSLAFRNTLLELNYKANEYLSRLFNQTVQIRFYNESEGGELSKILCEVTIDGNKRALGLYSGGQSRLIQLAVDLALSDLISSRNKNSISFRIFDEYFQNLDETSMEACLQLFQELKGTTILIEHNSLFKAIISNTINIELTNGISEVIQDGTQELDLQNLSGSY